MIERPRREASSGNPAVLRLLHFLRIRGRDSMAEFNDPQARAKKRATDMHASLDYTIQDERDTEALMEKLDKVASELFELAQDWDDVDEQMAARVREQEQRLHGLRSRVESMGEMEADEASKIITAIRQALREARGGNG
ncbi:hypothetical protein AB0K00_22740 [Dactylosporangium sp. NPDC049525]|uniref:hypothetical protein n=1 Tax=Dactylosporangium sp. NPDC049525 TaxID=3154730 RepID=UPI003432B381